MLAGSRARARARCSFIIPIVHNRRRSGGGQLTEIPPRRGGQRVPAVISLLFAGREDKSGEGTSPGRGGEGRFGKVPGEPARGRPPPPRKRQDCRRGGRCNSKRRGRLSFGRPVGRLTHVP